MFILYRSPVTQTKDLKNSYHKNIFYAIRDSDGHFILLVILKMAIPSR